MANRSFRKSYESSSDDDDSVSWLDSGHGFFAHAGDRGINTDLIVLDVEGFAKGGKPGAGGTGGGGGGTGGTIFPNYVSGDPNVLNSAEYNIEIVFKGSWTQSYVDQFIQAADYLTTYIH